MSQPVPRARHVAEAGVVTAVAAFHVLDHRVVDERWHLGSHTAAGLLAVLSAAGLGLSADDLGLAPERVAAGARLGAAAALPVVLAIGIATAMPSLEPLLDDPRVYGLPAGRVAWKATVDIPVGTAVYEELVFRSALLGLARRRLPDPLAIALTSTLFGLWHIAPALGDRQRQPRLARRPVVATVGPTVLGTALAGVGFAALRRRSRSVVAPIVLHAATNVAAMLAAVVVARRTHRRADPTDVDPVMDSLAWGPIPTPVGE